MSYGVRSCCPCTRATSVDNHVTSNSSRKETMNLHTVDTDRLNHPGAVDYFTRNAHRLAAVRALLQTLSLPFPDWAQREPSGRAATSRKIIAAFREDHPETLHQLTMC